MDRGGGKKTLQLVAKYADGWNYGLCKYDEYLSKISILRNCCKRVGKDYEKIAKAWHAIMLLGQDDNEIIMSGFESRHFLILNYCLFLNIR
jgi:hypothetical protein